jgi:hypothetical protein
MRCAILKGTMATLLFEVRPSDAVLSFTPRLTQIARRSTGTEKEDR